MFTPPDHIENEKRLLQQVAAGNEHAFKQLFDLRRQKVYSFAFHLTRSDLMAEEIVQEIFLRIWLHRRQLSDILHFHAWLNTLVRNLSYTWLRRMALEASILRDLQHRSGEASVDTQDNLQIREYRRLLQQAIDDLPPRQQEIYLLSRREELSYAAIADQLGLSINTVKNHMKEALRSMRRFLESHSLTLATACLSWLWR